MLRRLQGSAGHRVAPGSPSTRQQGAAPGFPPSRLPPSFLLLLCFPMSIPVSDCAVPPIKNQTLRRPQPHSVPSPSRSPSHQTPRRPGPPMRPALHVASCSDPALTSLPSPCPHPSTAPRSRTVGKCLLVHGAASVSPPHAEPGEQDPRLPQHRRGTWHVPQMLGK